MNEKLRTIISIILLTCVLVPVVGATYVLKNNGTIQHEPLLSIIDRNPQKHR